RRLPAPRPVQLSPTSLHTPVKIGWAYSARRRATFAQPFHGIVAAIGFFRRPSRRPAMKNTLVALAAAASLGAAALAAPSPAEAGGCIGWAVGAGVARGLIAGASLRP